MGADTGLEPRQPWRGAYNQKTDLTPARTVPMQVLNLGMMRTGTTSMQEALQVLEIPCWHGTSAFSRLAHCSEWRAALDAKFFNQGLPFTRERWDRLLGDFGAVSDVPAIAFAEDLVAAYPEAKVILVERNRDAWFNSFNEAVIGPCWNPVLQLIASLDPWFLGPLNSVTKRWVQGWFKATSAEDMRARALPMYEQHYALVRQMTPKHRLLEYELGSGWEPLCEFLGKPVPNVPFPRANEREALKAMVWQLGRKGATNAIQGLLVIMTPCLAFGLCYWLSGHAPIKNTWHALIQ